MKKLRGKSLTLQRKNHISIMSEQRFNNIPDNNQDEQNDQKIIDLASNVAEELRNTSKYPPHYNLMNEFCNLLNEDKHSDILAHLLEIGEVQESFINYFFKDLWNGSYKIHTRVSYEVHGKISTPDILLENSESFIIIENKIEGAAEQHEQMYRYVHDVGISYFHKKVNQIYVLYLKGSDKFYPTKYSTAKKDGENQIDVREELKDRFLVINYSEDIVKWIDEFINQNQNNENMRYVRSALFQYKDFLTYYKFKNDRDIINEAEMVGKIIEDSKIFNDEIMNNKENDVYIVKYIEKYNNNIKNLDFLKDRIPNLMTKLHNDIKKEISDSWIKKWKENYKDKTNFQPENLILKDSCEGIYVSLKEICDQYVLPSSQREKELPDDETLLGLFVNFLTDVQPKYKIKPWVGLYSKNPNLSQGFLTFSKNFSSYLQTKCESWFKELNADLNSKDQYTLWTFTSVGDGVECFYNWVKAIAEMLSPKQ